MTVAIQENNTTPEMGAFDERDEKVLNYLGLNPNNPADRAAVMVCRAYDLDAVLKHVVVIPRGGVYITRDGLLHIAHRSGQLDGIVVDLEPTVVNDEWVARVSVYRKDMSHPFTFPGRYPVNGGNNKQYAPEMALKAAEAHALRRAFAVAGLPALDEQRPARTEDHDPRPAADRMGAILHVEQEQPEPLPVAPEPDPLDGDTVTSAQLKKMGAAMREVGLTERPAALAYVIDVIGREVTTRNDLSKAEASAVIDALETEIAQSASADPAAEDDPWSKGGTDDA